MGFQGSIVAESILSLGKHFLGPPPKIGSFSNQSARLIIVITYVIQATGTENIVLVDTMIEFDYRRSKLIDVPIILRRHVDSGYPRYVRLSDEIKVMPPIPIFYEIARLKNPGLRSDRFLVE